MAVISRPEAATEVPRGRRVGDRFDVQRIEKHLVVPPQLDVVQSPTAAQQVVRDVQDVIGLVVRPVELQQVQPGIDALHQTAAQNHVVGSGEATVRHASGPLRELVGHAAAGKDRAPGVLPRSGPGQTAPNPTLMHRQQRLKSAPTPTTS